MGNNMKNRVSLGLLTFALSAGVLAITACQQDPFADKSDKIKNGVPPELQRDPPKEKAQSKDSYQIDALEFYEFHEQVESEITLSGRVLQAKATFTLQIDNLAKDFPGATFDSVTGIFKWTPPRQTTGGDYQKTLRMIVRLNTKDLVSGKDGGTTKEIPIHITRSELDPEFVTIDDIKTVPTREGEIRKFNVIVKDPDSADADGKRPVITSVIAQIGTADLSSLVYMQDAGPNPMQDPSNKQQWIFKMFLDLRVQADQRGRDFTRTTDVFKFGLKATTQFGRSTMKAYDAAVITDVLKPEISWFEPVEAIAGQENTIQFTVFDPYAEGNLSVNFISRVDQLQGAATASCKTASREGNVLCKISWKPLVTTTGDFEVVVEALNQSRVPKDLKFQKETFKRVIRVIPGQPPVVTPPAPPPGPHSTFSAKVGRGAK